MANIIRGPKIPKSRIELELGAHEFEDHHPIETSFPLLKQIPDIYNWAIVQWCCSSGKFSSSCIVLEALNMVNRIRETKTNKTRSELELGAHEFEHS
jgi:hypothetical protein